MPASGELAELLRRAMRQHTVHYTPAIISMLAGVSKATIVNWLDGTVTRPRRWQDLIRVASALRLSEADTDRLLRVAGHAPLGELLDQVSAAGDATLLAFWRRDARPAPSAQPARSFTNLPVPATPLVNRTSERAAMRALLLRDDVRLLTLSGVGGIGKTRLALQVAADLRDAFGDGVVFVSLAALTSMDLVLPTIARTFGLTEAQGQPLVAQLSALLADKQLLLLLDNFEHLLPAAPLLSALLTAAPRLKLLVTSRSVLRLSEEQEFHIAPLELPALNRLPPVEQLSAYAAVELFVQRAQALRPDFALTRQNAPLVAAICAQVDGLPLAIELAATRIKVDTPQRLLSSFDRGFSRLLGGQKALPERQRTIRATIEWSYRLLPAGAQALLAALSVFMGGWTHEAVETIVGVEQDHQRSALHSFFVRRNTSSNLLDGLMALVDSSLITRMESQDGISRFTMLETIREFAYEQLLAGSNAVPLRQRHCAYYLSLAERAEPLLLQPQQVAWLMTLDQEHDNLRAALRWALDSGDHESAARLGGALWRFWMIRGHLGEGRRWLEEILTHQEVLSSATRARALLAAGRLARQQGELEEAQGYLQAALATEQELGNRAGVAFLLGSLGVVAYDQADFARARSLHQQSLALRRELGDDWGVAATLMNLGEVTRQQGDPVRASELQTQSLTLYRQLGDLGGVSGALLNLGLLMRDCGDYVQATAMLAESLTLSRELGEQVDIAECLEGFAGLAAAQGQAPRAARLAGAAEAVREAANAPLSPADRLRYQRYLSMAEAQVEPQLFAAAWAEGRSFSLQQAIDYALDV
jgi:predicted ATPase